ncbi:MAG TPA: GIY-YIG nuclease family protein [Chitinophagales bacterium]|nr:GIY-YIG nuclease family protein [Chitinophagales bacterium]
MPCTFYILYSKDLDRYYIGHTCDQIEERLRKHLSNHKGFTAMTKDWEVVYTEYYPEKAIAYRREMEVKSWKKRSRIERLLEMNDGSEHPAP